MIKFTGTKNIFVSKNKKFSPMFEKIKNGSVPPNEKHFNLSYLNEFWNPEIPEGMQQHPLHLAMSFEKVLNREFYSVSPQHLWEIWEGINEDMLLTLNRMSVAEESAYWYNQIEQEWSDLHNRAQVFIEQSKWGYDREKALTFLAAVEREFLRYKKASLHLFARRRTTELVRDAHLHQRFDDIKEIIRQWLQPNWERSAILYFLNAEDFVTFRRGKAISPMDYFSMLSGKHVLTRTGFEFSMGRANDTVYLNDVYIHDLLTPGFIDKTWEFWSDTLWAQDEPKEGKYELDTVKSSRMAHELFTEVFSECFTGERHKEKTGFWLTAPNAACTQMWLDLESEFRSHINDVLHGENQLPDGRVWDYSINHRSRTSDGEDWRSKIDIQLRLADKFKHTFPDNYAHWQQILSSNIYRQVLESVQIPTPQDVTYTPLHREYTMRYGLEWPFFTENLPYTHDTFCMPIGISENRHSFSNDYSRMPTLGFANDYSQMPTLGLDISSDNVLTEELHWRIGAADLRIKAGLSTPKEELIGLLTATDWSGKEYIGTKTLPAHLEVFREYKHILGTKEEPWYLCLHHASQYQWGQSQEEWDSIILSYGLSEEGRTPILSLTQHWLSGEKWDLYRLMKKEVPDLDGLVLKFLNATRDLGYFRVLKLSNNISNSFESLFPSRKTDYIRHIGEGLDFLRFNRVVHEILSVRPILKSITEVPQDKDTLFMLGYIIEHLAERYTQVGLQSKTGHAKTFEQAMADAVGQLEQEALSVIGYSESEISDDFSFDEITFGSQ